MVYTAYLTGKNLTDTAHITGNNDMQRDRTDFFRAEQEAAFLSLASAYDDVQSDLKDCVAGIHMVFTERHLTPIFTKLNTRMATFTRELSKLALVGSEDAHTESGHLMDDLNDEVQVCEGESVLVAQHVIRPEDPEVTAEIDTLSQHIKAERSQLEEQVRKDIHK